MAFQKMHVAALSAVLLLGACSFADDALFPTLSASDPKAGAAPAPAGQGAPPALGTSNFETVSVTPGQPTGTFVGQKVSALRGDLQQLQSTIGRQNSALQQLRNETVQNSQRYYGTVAAINTRLQTGTTPGNPILMQQWNGAQAELDRISDETLKMNRLANEVAASSALSSYLLESVRAARGLSGAVDEDHRQLRILEDETNRTVVLIERLLTELTSDINRQQQYVANERSNLNVLALAIKNGQLYGTSLASAMAAPGTTTDAASLALMPADRPLVVIRFDRPNVPYENALYTAVKSALDRRPSSVFDVVAVSPATGTTAGQAALSSTTARRNAEAVVRSLTNMGLPPSRIRLSASSTGTANIGEVHVFVR
jgi:hypothetical protein